MKKNMGNLDKGIRVSLVALVLMYSYVGLIDGLLENVLLVVSTAMILTTVIGICPLYNLLGVKTIAVRKSETSE